MHFPVSYHVILKIMRWGMSSSYPRSNSRSKWDSEKCKGHSWWMTQQGSNPGLSGSRVPVGPAASLLGSGLGGEEAQAVISWAGKGTGWSKRPRGTEARPEHPRCFWTMEPCRCLKTVTSLGGVAGRTGRRAVVGGVCFSACLKSSPAKLIASHLLLWMK